MIKVPEGHEEQCHKIKTFGRCQYRKVYGSDYCRAHGGDTNIKEREDMKNYQLTKWQEQISRNADSPEIKKLNEEVGILRFCLQSVLNNVKDEGDLARAQPQVQSLVKEINSTIQALHKIELQTGNLLGKAAVSAIAEDIISSVTSNLANIPQLIELTDSQESKLKGLIDDALSNIAEDSIKTINERTRENYSGIKFHKVLPRSL